MSKRYSFGLSRLLITVVTIAGVFAAVAWNQTQARVTVEVGSPSPQRFVASEDVIGIVDEAATATDREAAAAAVEPVFATAPEINESVRTNIIQLFEDVRSNVVEAEPALTVEVEDPFAIDPTIDDPVTSDESDSTTTTGPPNRVVVTGRLYLDLDGDGLFSEELGDLGLAGVDVRFIDDEGSITAATTDAMGFYLVEVEVEGPLLVQVATGDPQFPDSFALTTANNPFVIDDTSVDDVELDPIGFGPAVVDSDIQIRQLAEKYPVFIDDATIPTLVEIARGDVIRAALGQEIRLDVVESKSIERANQALTGGISSEQLQQARQQVLEVKPLIFFDNQIDEAAETAAADVVASNLVPNLVLDATATDQKRAEAREAVEPTLVDFRAGETIVSEGERVSTVQLAAIDALELLRPTGFQYAGMASVATVLVLLVMLYLARFRPGFWRSTQRVALLGLLLVLAAVAVRLSDEIQVVAPGLEGFGGYAIPAAGFGFVVAILFDGRMAVLMAVSIGVITAVATNDPGFTTYAILSAIGPVPFVSSISTRADFRRALLFGSIAAGVVAAATSWYFHSALIESLSVEEIVLRASLLAFVVSLIATLAGGTSLSFFEVMFDITTTLRLLDVTDRNHPALQLLQDEAWGTFNHSLMVGSLAASAAKEIGANNLLVLAAAYYHDLGKTQNPMFFIENQFGQNNPHDNLPPEESAEIIRQHVTDGIELARRYRIPSEVAAGIMCHHGDGIMRYFYEKAKTAYGENHIDVEDYRHRGFKPRTREMAILMMADALEGATRAIFMNEEPSPEKIRAAVERVVAEKVNDGQLSESDLTLGDLTRVKEAFVEALIGHYHQRIPYPNFPDQAAMPGGAVPLPRPQDRREAAPVQSNEPTVQSLPEDRS